MIIQNKQKFINKFSTILNKNGKKNISIKLAYNTINLLEKKNKIEFYIPINKIITAFKPIGKTEMKKIAGKKHSIPKLLDLNQSYTYGFKNFKIFLLNKKENFIKTFNKEFINNNIDINKFKEFTNISNKKVTDNKFNLQFLKTRNINRKNKLSKKIFKKK